MIQDVLQTGLEMGILAKKLAQSRTCNLIFCNAKAFFRCPRCFFVLFLKEGGDSVRNTCGKQLKPDKGTELLVVV